MHSYQCIISSTLNELHVSEIFVYNYIVDILDQSLKTYQNGSDIIIVPFSNFSVYVAAQQVILEW